MMRKFSWMLLVLLAFSVYAEDEKGITAKKIIWKKDEAKMVRIPERWDVVPAKVIAATYDKFGILITAETMIPEKTVKVFDAFYMDTYEVTVGQFKKFLKSLSYKPAKPIDWDDVSEYSPTDEHPMVHVSWFDAAAYAKWARKRLPTEKEWEWAARGGLKNKEYPWGNDKSLARDYANYLWMGGTDKWARSTAPVGSFKPNGYGLYDITGNAWEWCQDWSNSNKEARVIRGGGWRGGTGRLRVARHGYASPPNGNNDDGFRCVVSDRP